MGDPAEPAGMDVDQREFWNRWNATFRAGLEGEWRPDEASRLRHEAILAWIPALELRRAAILDLCCGAGWLSEQLRAFGSVTAVDIADAVVAQAQARFPQVRFVAGDFYELELPRDHYDLVVCVDGLSCVPDQPRFVRRVAERLKPGGHLIVATPNRFVWERIEQHDARAAAPIRTWHSRKELKALVAPWFRVVHLTTVAPAGHRGLLRVVNSYKLDALLKPVSASGLRRVRERLGFGGSLVLLAVKRS